MRKIIIIIFASLMLVLVGLYSLGILLDDKKGMIYIVSLDPGNNSIINKNQDINLEIWYIIWKYSPKADYYISYGYGTDNQYSHYQLEKIQLNKLLGRVSVKTNIADVICGLNPIVRETVSPSEITERIFFEASRKGLGYDEINKQIKELRSCKYKDIKYPFELKATLNYKFKQQTFGSYRIDSSNRINFKLNELLIISTMRTQLKQK